MWNKKFPGEASARAYNKMRDGRCNHQRDEAIALKNQVGIPDRPGTIEDVYLYEEYLQVSIVIIGARASNRKVYPGSPKFEDKIFLYHSGKPPNTHFDTIVKVNGLLNKSYYCDYCDKGF